MFNEIKIMFQHSDGRKFRAERGKVTFKIGREPDHMMFVIRGEYDWGLRTTRDLMVLPSNTYHLIEELTRVFNYSWFNSLIDAEAYFLFSEEYVAHEGPLGIVNINDPYNVLIFDDFYKSLEQKDEN